MKRLIFLTILMIGIMVLNGCSGKVSSLNDLTTCDARKPVNIKAGCYIEVARAKNDLTVCEKINEGLVWENACYADMAEFRKDSSICEKIEGETPKTFCYQKFE